MSQPTLASVPANGPGVADGLRLIERLLRLEIERLRALGLPAGRDEYRGLYVSDEEVNQLLGLGPRLEGPPEVEPFETALTRERIALAKLTQSAAGRLGRLVRLAGLDPFDTGCVLLALALEADSRFERFFAYVQDDVTKRRPRVDLALRLLAERPNRESLRQRLSAEAPLRQHRLVTLHNEPGQAYTPLPAQFLALDARVAAYLLGHDTLDENLLAHARRLPPRAGPPELPLPGALAQRLRALAQLPPTRLQPPVVHLAARDGAELEPAAEALITETGLHLLEVNLPPLAAAYGLEAALTLAQREAAFQPAALLLLGAHRLKPEDSERLRQRLQQRLTAPLVFVASDGAFRWPGLTITLPMPDVPARRALWAHGLNGESAVPEHALGALADKFRLNAAQIADALKVARAAAVWRDPTGPTVTLDDLYAAARTQSTPILSSLARKIKPHYSWDDIVLPDDTLQQLRELCAYVEHRHTVYQQWGFERKLALGRGLMALFAGQSGTGKTMAADILAGVLGLDLYKIDLSGVVSKYIGETEKNLDRIFAEAENSNAILFFDEADALFGKRSEVKDAHDRYANIETAYLLQKMEEYAGVVILATNLKMNLDEAFIRRMHVVVDFPMPEEEDRLRIWEQALPAEVPRAPNVDLSFMARKFRLSGGNIRNIVLAAAFRAAAEGEVLAMSHLVQATRREFQKLGRMVTLADFGDYYEEVNA